MHWAEIAGLVVLAMPRIAYLHIAPRALAQLTNGDLEVVDM